MISRLILAVAAAGAILAAGTMVSNALMLAPEGLRGAIQETKLTDNVACWRYGWRGWGWYRCWGY